MIISIACTLDYGSLLRHRKTRRVLASFVVDVTTFDCMARELCPDSERITHYHFGVHNRTIEDSRTIRVTSEMDRPDECLRIQSSQHDENLCATGPVLAQIQPDAAGRPSHGEGADMFYGAPLIGEQHPNRTEYAPEPIGAPSYGQSGWTSGQEAMPWASGNPIEGLSYHPNQHYTTRSHFPPPPYVQTLAASYINVPGISADGAGQKDQVTGNRLKYRRSKFPVKLMHALVQFPNEEALIWMPSGAAFVIVNPDLFVAEILSKVCNVIKYPSFVRKLHRWGFTRLPSRTYTDCFWHPCFNISYPERASLIAATSHGSGKPGEIVPRRPLLRDDPSNVEHPGHPVWVEALNHARDRGPKIQNALSTTLAAVPAEPPRGPPPPPPPPPAPPYQCGSLLLPRSHQEERDLQCISAATAPNERTGSNSSSSSCVPAPAETTNSSEEDCSCSSQHQRPACSTIATSTTTQLRESPLRRRMAPPVKCPQMVVSSASPSKMEDNLKQLLSQGVVRFTFGG